MSVTRSRRSRWGLSLVLVTVFAALASSYGDVPASLRPGPLGGGITLLPNGWKIAPAGRHLQVGSLPLAMVESPDGRSLYIASNGYMKPAITIVDVKAQRVSVYCKSQRCWFASFLEQQCASYLVTSIVAGFNMHPRRQPCDLDPAPVCLRVTVDTLQKAEPG